jgi:hypothetical protein
MHIGEMEIRIDPPQKETPRSGCSGFIVVFVAMQLSAERP